MTTRLPPNGFLLSCVRYGLNEVDDYGRQIASAMRGIYPELAHWHDSALVEALGDYGEDVEWCADFSIPKLRNEDLIGYLYARQVMPVYQFLHFEPKDLDEAWQFFDAGLIEEHSLELFDRVPMLKSIFQTKEDMLENLK